MGKHSRPEDVEVAEPVDVLTDIIRDAAELLAGAQPPGSPTYREVRVWNTKRAIWFTKYQRVIGFEK